jgi:guanosine-3',5'-bis(diphosphate) 3'-pyrophosphohydrolase
MNVSRLLQALDFAANKHQSQRRKSGHDVPYINHPITVARILAEVGKVEDEDVLVAAALHDTLEDTETTREELAAAFGNRVLGLVEEVTDDTSLPKARRKRLQVEHASSLSTGAALIKLADKIANVQDMSHAPPANWPAEQVREYLDWAEEVVQNCPDVSRPLRERFDNALREGRQKWHVGRAS